ncbi:hypothetical protein DFH06DRAFT_1212538, partial [Mycena polygramma]
SPCPSTAPLLLTQICHHWRQIALDTPGLWQSVIFIDHRMSVELLRLWLSRSGTLPLNFTIHCWDPLGVDTLIEAAMSHSHHWQDIKLGLPLSSFEDLDLRHTPFPILRAISLDVSHWTSHEVIEALVIQDAPSLREVHVSTFPNIKIGLPWPQLTALTLREDVELTECLSLLRGCSGLVALTVRTIESAAPRTDVLALDLLQSLDCNMSDGADSTRSLLQYLTLPRLERLTITDAGAIENSSVFGAFIIRSVCRNLRHLSLSICGNIRPENFTPFFRAVPDSVSELQLVWPRGGFPGQLSSALLPIDILPHVTTLRLQGGQLPDTGYRTLLDMLRTRLRASFPPLCSLVLEIQVYPAYNHQYGPTTFTMSQFRELAAAGLKIKFTVTSRSEYSTRVLLDSDTA